jgi:hypothetical protein
VSNNLHKIKFLRKIKFLGLDDPIMVSLCQSFERKSDAIRALIEAVLREEACAEDEATDTAIGMLENLEDRIREAGGGSNESQPIAYSCAGTP